MLFKGRLRPACQVIIRTRRLVQSDKRTCLMAEDVEGLVFVKTNLNNF